MEIVLTDLLTQIFMLLGILLASFVLALLKKLLGVEKLKQIEAELTAHAYHENLIREGTKHLRLTVLEACVNLGEHPDHAYLMLDRIRESEKGEWK